jgi:hypothetical protein
MGVVERTEQVPSGSPQLPSRPRLRIRQRHAHCHKRACAVRIKPRFNIVVRRRVWQVHSLHVNNPGIRLKFQIFTGQTESIAFAILPFATDLAPWSRLIDADKCSDRQDVPQFFCDGGQQNWSQICFRFAFQNVSARGVSSIWTSARRTCPHPDNAYLPVRMSRSPTPCASASPPA